MKVERGTGNTPCLPSNRNCNSCATHGLPPADPGREAEQIARLRVLADNAKLDPDFAEKFLNFIVKEVIRHHEAIRQNK